MILLAKSVGHGGTTLLQHTRDVVDAATTIWSSVGADVQKLLPNLPTEVSVWVNIAASLHDLMKANSAYQKMVETDGKTPERQPVRHEVLAAAFLSGAGELAKWFSELVVDEKLRWSIIWAIAAHHFKMVDPVKNPKHPAYRDAGVAKTVTLFLGHPDIQILLSNVAKLLNKNAIPKLSNISFETIEDDLRYQIEDYLDEACRKWKIIQADSSSKQVISVLKALLASSDAAGSATAERDLLTSEWVRHSLSRRLTTDDLRPVLVKDLGVNFEKVKQFQSDVGNSSNTITVVTAGCGNGKTTAAYLWANKWAIGKKLFFLYPTTGTATAGYETYLAEQDSLEKALLHGRSEVDLKAIHGNKEDDNDESAVKIESLRAWNPKVASCTVDTVMGLMQSQRRGVYSFPAFAAGAFVFDEIHAYDSKLWGGLLRFLKEFPGVHALLMSASIPPHRQKQLKEIVGDRMGEIIKGDKNLEGYQRYRLSKRTDATACFGEVLSALNAGKKVLWVCNTVGDAIGIARQMTDWPIKPVIYHSRFRYRDRVERQKSLIAAFRAKGPLLAVTTQVCEMSLDISADLLVTAECPLPSLVQRLGRLNRYANSDDPWLCLVYPFQGLPYNEDPKKSQLYGDYSVSMKAARKLVTDLENQPCSQKDLADRLEQMFDSETPDMYAALFDDGWTTEPTPVRDSDQSITIILKENLDEIASEIGSNRKKWSAGKLAPWTIPMNFPAHLKPFDWSKAGPYPIATNDVITYCKVEGAQWLKK